MAFVSALARFNAQTVLLFGSSAFAASLVKRLVHAGARVRWFPRDVGVAEELWLSGEPRQIEIAFREPRAIDFEEAAAVIATIGEPIVLRLSEQARASGCPVALLGRPELSTFSLAEESDEEAKDQKTRSPQSNTTSRRPAAWISVHTTRARRLLSSLALAFDS
jgi:siroheme synthase (precorrin-2 oxidase/ferrochelatase)